MMKTPKAITTTSDRRDKRTTAQPYDCDRENPVFCHRMP